MPKQKGRSKKGSIRQTGSKCNASQCPAPCLQCSPIRLDWAMIAKRREAAMPEPNYSDGTPPGLFVMLMGTIAVVIVFVLFKSCMGGG